MIDTITFEAFTNSDLNEGRGSLVHLGYFTLERDAKDVAKGQGVMGQDGSVRQVHIRIYETLGEYHDQMHKDIRKTALEKLTPLERKVLGL